MVKFFTEQGKKNKLSRYALQIIVESLEQNKLLSSFQLTISVVCFFKHFMLNIYKFDSD